MRNFVSIAYRYARDDLGAHKIEPKYGLEQRPMTYRPGCQPSSESVTELRTELRTGHISFLLDRYQ
jgi:hypothetical protein